MRLTVGTVVDGPPLRIRIDDAEIVSMIGVEVVSVTQMCEALYGTAKVGMRLLVGVVSGPQCLPTAIPIDELLTVDADYHGMNTQGEPG